MGVARRSARAPLRPRAAAPCWYTRRPRPCLLALTRPRPPSPSPRPAAKGAGEAGTSASAAAADDISDTLKCAICLNACERPVTAPCQHNFCLACFKKWTYQSKTSCPTCRAPFSHKFAQNPRINTALAMAIRLAKAPANQSGAGKEYVRLRNESRPDEAFTTERAVRAGRANAASGRIMVNVPNDHFGPILPEHDPTRNRVSTRICHAALVLEHIRGRGDTLGKRDGLLVNFIWTTNDSGRATADD